jgi:predicted permease
MTRVEPGFSNPDQVQLVYVSDPGPNADQTLRTQRAIVAAVAAIPGVTAVGYSDLAPIGTDNRGNDTVLTVEASKPVPGQPRPLRRFQFISPEYFRTLGTPIVAGRDVEWADLEERRQVAFVSATLARQEWGSPTAALGKRVQVTPADPWREVVGVIGDVRDDGMDRPAPPIVYFPARVDRFWGTPAIAFGNVTLAIRSPRAGTDAFVREIERAVSGVNADVPVAQIRRLADVYRASLARTSFTLTLLLIAGAMGLLLGVIGIYGVVAYSVLQRKREIGIRLALGARPGQVTGLFLRRGVVLACIGGVSGIVAASMLTRVMSSLLVGVSSVDPLTYAAVASVVLFVVIASAYAAARRTMRRDAADALR